MVEQKWISEGLFNDSKKAKQFWIKATNKNCSMRTETKGGKVELFIKRPFYVIND